MSQDRTRLERLATAGLPHTLLEPIVRVGAEADPAVGELAFAARAMPQTEWYAFLFLFKDDNSVSVIACLRAWLQTVAVDLYFREHWPSIKVRDKATHYLIRLADMVLLEAKNPEAYQTISRRAAAFGVGEQAWCERLERPYASLSAAFRGLGKRAEHYLTGADE